MPVANKTVENNFLAGGGYTIYGGDALGNPTSNIVIKGNRFGQLYYATSGQYGPGAYFNATATGNVWSGNTWDTTGQPSPPPDRGIVTGSDVRPPALVTSGAARPAPHRARGQAGPM